MYISKRLRLQIVCVMSFLTIFGTILFTKRAYEENQINAEVIQKRLELQRNNLNLQNANKMRMQWANPPAKDGEYYLPTISSRYQIPIVLQELQVRLNYFFFQK
jgi:hypothetical protein